MTRLTPRVRARLVWLGVCAVLAVLVALDPRPVPSWPGVDQAPVSRAFWPLFIAVASAIWKALEVAGRITLQALAWSVRALWAFAGAIANAAKAVGKAFAIAGKEIWSFMRTTLARAIVAGWKKFWHLVDRFRAWLERSFKPVLDFLFMVRRRLMDFYTRWIRPVLDVIDIGRKVARVLGALGIEWAQALDRRLMEIQEAIDRPFRAVLARVNEIIGIVNRVVTADGLFQRLALIRSIERDVRYVFNTLHNAQSKPLTDDDRESALARDNYKTGQQFIAETRVYLETGDGPNAASIDEWSQDLAIRLRTP